MKNYDNIADFEDKLDE